MNTYFRIFTRLPKKLMPWVVALLVGIIVLTVLLLSNLGIINIISYFDNSEVFADQMVLFYGEGCSQCDKVEKFIKDNTVDAKVDFVRLEVFGSQHNENILYSKAQICALDSDHLGVPLLWNGPERKCVVGYLDIINFLKQAAKTQKK